MRFFIYLNWLFVELIVGNVLSLYILFFWYLLKDFIVFVYGGNMGVIGVYFCIYYINVIFCFEIECECVCVCLCVSLVDNV